LSCEPNDPPAPEDTDTFDRAALTSAIVNEVTKPRLVAFATEAAKLAASPTPATWKSTMLAWQELEVLQFGQIKDVRDEILSWPTVNACAIDQETLAKSYENAGFFGAALVTKRGLAAIEYLLFREDGDNACAPVIGIDGEWSLLGDAEVAARRLAYAQAAAADVSKRANDLRDAFDAVPTVDEIFEAWYHVELIGKDKKLAIPLGLNLTCPKATCPELLESPWAKHSKENLRANLVAFKAVYLAGGKGFDAFLRAREAAATADAMGSAIDGAIAAIDAVQGSFEAALVEDPAPVRAVYDAVKDVTDLLKTEVVGNLDLRVPQQGAGDND
jgi:predicted lipoprotein